MDAKKFLEYTPGVMRAYVKPAHLDADLQPPQLGKVKSLDGKVKIATIKPIFFERLNRQTFDYCMICSGVTLDLFTLTANP